MNLPDPILSITDPDTGNQVQIPSSVLLAQLAEQGFRSQTHYCKAVAALVSHAERLRTAQRLYFKTKGRNELITARNLETQFDNLLASAKKITQ